MKLNYCQILLVIQESFRRFALWKYIQASYIIGSDETRQREFGVLKGIADNYPKYVISMTPLVSRTDDEGIQHISLREFLKNGL